MGKYFLILLVFLLVFTSCDNNNSPVLTGSMTGFVRLYHDDGTPYRNCSGVKVQLEGKNYYDLTDSSGKYTIKKVPAGIYNVVFSKAGFAVYKLISKDFPGGGEAYYSHVTLLEIPTFEVTDLTIAKDTSINSSYYIIRGTASNKKNYFRNIIVFFGNLDVSSDPLGYKDYDMIQLNSDSLTFYDYISNWELNSNGFQTGDTVYAIAYSISSSAQLYSVQFYPDPNSGGVIFTGLGNKGIKASFILK